MTAVTGETVTTGLNMPAELLSLLKAVAMKRSKELGGRPSVSAILCGLAEEKRADLDTRSSC